MGDQKKKNKEIKETKKAEPDKKQAQKEGFLARFLKLDIKKKIQYVAILLVIIVILAIYFAASSPAPVDNEQSQSIVLDTQSDSVEERLKQTLSGIQGAGRVEVMITYESSAEIVPAISVDTQTSTTTDTNDNGNSTTNTENKQSEIVTVGTNNGTSALVLREISPEVRGVLVIAEGADDIGVRLNLLSAVQTILNVSPDRVDVYKMNNE